jgi:hypothetical protein
MIEKSLVKKRVNLSFINLFKAIDYVWIDEIEMR